MTNGEITAVFFYLFLFFCTITGMWVSNSLREKNHERFNEWVNTGNQQYQLYQSGFKGTLP